MNEDEEIISETSTNPDTLDAALGDGDDAALIEDLGIGDLYSGYNTPRRPVYDEDGNLVSSGNEEDEVDIAYSDDDPRDWY